VSRVVACALVDNLASVRVLEKAGLTREGETQFPGFESPAIVFAIAKASESGRSEGNSSE
jgi:RimJ/RimL family protein N-acetyltransferase